MRWLLKFLRLPLILGENLWAIFYLFRAILNRGQIYNREYLYHYDEGRLDSIECPISQTNAQRLHWYLYSYEQVAHYATNGRNCIAHAAKIPVIHYYTSEIRFEKLFRVSIIAVSFNNAHAMSYALFSMNKYWGQVKIKSNLVKLDWMTSYIAACMEQEILI